MPANKKIHLPNPKQARLLKFNGRLKNIVGDIAGGLRRLLLLLLSLIVLMHIAACLLHYIALQPFFGEPGDGEGELLGYPRLRTGPPTTYLRHYLETALMGSHSSPLPLDTLRQYILLPLLCFPLAMGTSTLLPHLSDSISSSLCYWDPHFLHLSYLLLRTSTLK